MSEIATNTSSSPQEALIKERAKYRNATQIIWIGMKQIVNMISLFPEYSAEDSSVAIVQFGKNMKHGKTEISGFKMSAKYIEWSSW